MTWLPSRSGLAVDLVQPQAVQVDFGEIAHALAHLNRYAGNARQPVSVGLHTLIGADLLAREKPVASSRLIALWLLHDAHEARLGDLTSPYKEATRALAAELYGTLVADKLEDVRRSLELRHDVVIHQAAGLTLPTDAQARHLKRIDLAALATERRDFCTRGPLPRPWAIDRADLGIAPGPKVWRWMPPVAVEHELLDLFRTHLPVLAQGRPTRPMETRLCPTRPRTTSPA